MRWSGFQGVEIGEARPASIRDEDGFHHYELALPRLGLSTTPGEENFVVAVHESLRRL